jgi:drug/metabolite transporter (DMT)-like permease
MLTNNSKERFALLKLFLAPILWGSGLVAGRIISGELPPFTPSCIRFIIAGLLMASYLRI